MNREQYQQKIFLHLPKTVGVTLLAKMRLAPLLPKLLKSPPTLLVRQNLV